MTRPEWIALAKKCLAEHESGLNVSGPIEPYRGATLQAKSSFIGSLDSVDERWMQNEISKVLNQLAAIPLGFRMTEPDPCLTDVGYKVTTARHGNLNLSYVTMFDANKLEPITHVICWYHLA
jgi:hypothetical protein